jgi:hypothetical protein
LMVIKIKVFCSTASTLPIIATLLKYESHKTKPLSYFLQNQLLDIYAVTLLYFFVRI